MNRQPIIAIDGYSACGKSTLAFDLSRKFGLIHIDSGAMYRAATLHFLNTKVDIHNIPEVGAALTDIHLTFVPDGVKHVVSLNGTLPGDALRSQEVDQHVSQVAKISSVRETMVKLQQEIAQRRGVIMDGRDIGTVVFPDAELKVFLRADLDVRVRRRYLELGTHEMHIPREQVTRNLKERDRIDTSRKVSPLVKADDAVVIDNSNLTREEQMEMVSALVRCRMR